MEAFCGIYTRNKNLDAGNLINKMLSHLVSPTTMDQYVFSHQYFTFGILHERRKLAPVINESRRFFLFVSGRIDQGQFCTDVISKDEAFDRLLTDQLESVLSDLRGDFVFVLYDKLTGNLVCAGDQMGTRPCYFHKGTECLCIAGEINAFRAVPFISFEIDDQWIADSLSLLQSEKHLTPYIEIKKLVPGNKLTYNKEVKITPYWALEYGTELCNLSFDSALKLFTEKLIQSVKRRVEGYKILGTELSGGLDSSGITAFAKHNLRDEVQSLYALSHILSPENKQNIFPYKDELYYSNVLSESLKLNGHLLCPGNDLGILDSVKRSFHFLSGPSQQGFHFYSDVLFETAAHYGIETLISGFGGDEGVSSNAYGFFKEMKIKGNRTSFQDELLMRYIRNGLDPFQARLRTLLHYHITPLIDWSRLPGERHIPRGIEKIFNNIDRDFLKEMQIKNRFRERFVFADNDILGERQVRQLSHNHIPQRLEYSFLMAKSYGIEYSYPLLDIDLIQLYIELPAEYKFRNGMGRALFRESLRDIVPDQIRLREDKSGFTIPSVFSRISNDYDGISELIRRCKGQNSFHYVDYSYLADWLESLTHLTSKTAGRFPGPGPFINAIQVLLLQDMQRSGEFISGIKT